MGSVSLAGSKLVLDIERFIQRNECSEEMHRVLKWMFQLVDRHLEMYETRDEFYGADQFEDDL